MPANLELTARALVAPGKGILAADESDGTIKKRLASVDVDSTFEARRAYRELLLTTEEVESYISGVILFDETLRQTTAEGTPFAEALTQKGIIPGIKVDKGTVDLPHFPGERITEGLDGLRGRLVEYRELGARFAKWRAVITIAEDRPSDNCLVANAEVLARYAALCQEQGLVPIVEPEVLMDGGHPIERCQAVTEATLQEVFAALQRHRIMLEGMLLKPNMVLPGQDASSPASVTEVAERTVRSLRRTVPAAVPGIVFLSGGQSPELATKHLSAMNAMGRHPWELSFSYGRALQEPVLKTWRGKEANIAAAQQRFYQRAQLNSVARMGQYSPQMEKA